MASSDIIKQERPRASVGADEADEDTGAVRREEPDLFPDFLVEPRPMWIMEVADARGLPEELKHFDC